MKDFNYQAVFPQLAEAEFSLAAKTAILSFIAVGPCCEYFCDRPTSKPTA